MANIKLELHTDEVLNALDSQIKTALTAVGMQAETYAKQLAPVGTPESTGIPGYVGGRLRNSITYALGGEAPAISSWSDNQGGQTEHYNGTAPEQKNTIFIGSGAKYAAVVELGSSNRRAKPYLKPAIMNNKDDFKNIVENILKK